MPRLVAEGEGLTVGRHVPTGVLNLLRRIQAVPDEDGGPELVYEPGGGWWVGLDRTSGRAPRQALLLVLLHLEADSRLGGLERYTVNEEGRRALEDPDYRPLILNALEERARRT